MNHTGNVYRFQDHPQVQAVVQKPIKYLENVWGQAIRHDVQNRSIDTEMSFWPTFGKDRLNTGNLPFATSPRLRNNIERPFLPVDTRVSRVCWNEALAQAGPFYLRHWQIWDNAPFQPSMGDVSNDPRYGTHTRQFTKTEKFGGI